MSGRREEALAAVRAGLRVAMRRLEASGLEGAPVAGSLVRPLVAYAGAARPGQVLPEAFWLAAAAVQLAHEASLVHDDVVDGATQRRGSATEAARGGVGAALIRGDHLLTWGYRAAAETGSAAFMRHYAEAVERTVAGELAQSRRRGAADTMAGYEAVVTGKSGQLLGCALAAAPLLRGDGRSGAFARLGRRLGVLYQMLDDLLDYCPAADRGKDPYGDYARGLWTWPLLEAPDLAFGGAPAEVGRRLSARAADGTTALGRCADRFRGACRALRADVRALLPEDEILAELVDGWEAEVAAAVDAELARGASVPARDWLGVVAQHSRSFRFAVRFFPVVERAWVSALYAYCRSTDDLVDEARGSAADVAARLDAWESLTRAAFAGQRTGVAVIDAAVGDAVARGVSMEHALRLIEGVRMDLRHDRYPTLEDLRRYTACVASAVGLWMTERAGVRDAGVLERAAALGHAMQLTNIARDVGEDWARGRLYLPLSLLAAHGLAPDEVGAMAEGRRPVDARFRATLEDLLRAAEREYDRAFEAIPALPRPYQAPVAVAAEVYRGIHEALRGAGWDPFVARARTGALGKVRLAARALWRLRRERRAWRERLRGPSPRAAGPAADRSGAMPRSGLQRVGSGRIVLALLLALGGMSALPGAGSAQASMAALRGLTERAADRGAVVDSAMEEVAALRRAGGVDRPLLRAYEGVLRLLRAKHGWWPPSRLSNARRGLALLDAAVQERPGDPEIRFLRLRAVRGLPARFDRDSTAKADLRALEASLDSMTASLPATLHAAMVQYVRGRGPGEERDG